MVFGVCAEAQLRRRWQRRVTGQDCPVGSLGHGPLRLLGLVRVGRSLPTPAKDTGSHEWHRISPPRPPPNFWLGRNWEEGC